MKSVVVIAGSISSITVRQVSKAMKALNIKTVDFNMYEVFGEGDKTRKEVARVVGEVKKVLRDGVDVTIRWVQSSEFVSEAMKHGKEKGIKE